MIHKCVNCDKEIGSFDNAKYEWGWSGYEVSNNLRVCSHECREDYMHKMRIKKCPKCNQSFIGRFLGDKINELCQACIT